MIQDGSRYMYDVVANILVFHSVIWGSCSTYSDIVFNKTLATIASCQRVETHIQIYLNIKNIYGKYYEVLVLLNYSQGANAIRFVSAKCGSATGPLLPSES
jgi:hypothetical protein